MRWNIKEEKETSKQFENTLQKNDPGLIIAHFREDSEQSKSATVDFS